MDEEDWQDISGGKKLRLASTEQSGNSAKKITKIGSILLKSVGFSGKDAILKVSDSTTKGRKRAPLVSTAASSKMSAGFGIGALEEEDEDDQDIYSNKDYTPVFQIENDLKHKLKQPEIASFSSSGNGFVKASIGVIVFENISTVIEIPPDWKPKSLAVVTTTSSSSRNHGGDMDARKRAKILGEEELYQVETESKESKEKDNIVNDIVVNCPWLMAYPDLKRFTGLLGVQQAIFALQGFQPFTQTNPEKQIRYTRFLNACINASLWRELIFPPEYQESDIYKELEEFTMAARVYQPMGASMASRFVRGSTSSSTTTTVGTVAKNTNDNENHVSSSRDSLKQYERDAVLAKRMGIGLTRSSFDWTPATLLCKRLGIKDPHPDKPVSSLSGGGGGSSSTGSGFGGAAKMLLAPESILPILSDHMQTRRQHASDFFETAKNEEDQNNEEDDNISLKKKKDEAPLPDRPEMSLFQSIFGNGEEIINDASDSE